LLFAEDLVLLASSEQVLQYAILDRFAAACDQAGINISAKKTQCTLQVSSNTLQQVKFTYLVVVFTSDGRRNKEFDTRIFKLSSKKFTYLVVVFTSDGRRNKEFDTRIFKLSSNVSFIALW